MPTTTPILWLKSDGGLRGLLKVQLTTNVESGPFKGGAAAKKPGVMSSGGFARVAMPGEDAYQNRLGFGHPYAFCSDSEWYAMTKAAANRE